MGERKNWGLAYVWAASEARRGTHMAERRRVVDSILRTRSPGPRKLTFGHEGHAQKLLAKRHAEIEADTFVGPAAQGLRYEQMRGSLYADYKTNHRKWLRRDRDGNPYLCGVSHLDDFFAGQRALAITTSGIRKFIEKRQADGASNGTINRELALLRRMFNLALQDGILRTIPHFPMLREAAPRKGFLEYTDFQRLRLELPEYLRPVVTVGYYSGVRLGGLPKIHWNSVDQLRGEIRLDPGTTKK